MGWRRALLLASAAAAPAWPLAAESLLTGAWAVDREAWRQATAEVLLESVQGRQRGLTARMVQMLETRLVTVEREQERNLTASFVLHADGRFELVDPGGTRLLTGRWRDDGPKVTVSGDGPAGAAAWQGAFAGERMELQPEPGPDGEPSPLLGGVPLFLIRRP